MFGKGGGSKKWGGMLYYERVDSQLRSKMGIQVGKHSIGREIKNMFKLCAINFDIKGLYT